MACSASCGGTQTSLGKCTILKRKGGGVRLVGYTCDYSFTDITDSTEWDTQIGLAKAFYGPEGKISKDRGTATTADVTSCKTEVIGWEQSVKFICYDSEADDSDYDFYAQLQNEGGSRLVLGYLTEDDKFYQLDGVSVQPDDVREENSKLGSTYWDVDLIYKSESSVKPITIAGLNDAVNALL